MSTDPSPDSIDRTLQLLEAKKRKNRLLLVGGALIAVAGVVALTFANKSQGNAALEKTWNEAAGCIFGGPLDEDEKPSLRFHRLKMALGGTESRWPGSCQDAIATLNLTLAKQHTGDALHEQSNLLLKQIQGGEIDKSQAHLIDKLVASAKKIGLSTSELAGPTDPELKAPTPLSGLSVTSVPKEARLTEHSVEPHSVSSDNWPGEELRLLLNDKDHGPPVVCTFHAKDANARCWKATAKVGKLTDLRILGTASPGAAPLLVGRDISEDVVIRLSDGQEIVRDAGINSGHLDASGSVTLATSPKNRRDGTFEVIVQNKPGAELVRHTVQPANLKANDIDNWAVAQLSISLAFRLAG